MSQFFKFTSFKLILTILILVLPLIGGLLYGISIVPWEEKLTIEANWAVKAIYYISEALFCPFIPIQNVLWEIYSSSGLPLYFILLPLFLAYSYFLSCIISFFVNKIQSIRKTRTVLLLFGFTLPGAGLLPIF